MSAPRTLGHFRVDYCRNTGVVYRLASLFALPQMRRGYQRLAKWLMVLPGRYLPDLAFI